MFYQNLNKLTSSIPENTLFYSKTNKQTQENLKIKRDKICLRGKGRGEQTLCTTSLLLATDH
ncbi:MAG TPA: hypothetical protein DEF48_09710 [Nostoc sp. UBA8866]|nr:hypothetical protein [Nostoc sp. UBA8866]